ncbi:MAG: alpha-glucosidase C-terminal domain-containing protein [Lewinellaceae bacterium]|nr:alpha-glucosidase C-terminal domain-containing protein [Lewinellaceae bacterium]
MTLVYGAYTLLDAQNPSVYCYLRELNGRKLLVLLNFTALPVTAQTGLDLSKAKVLLGNYPAPALDGRLKPYEAVILDLG